MIAQFWKGSIQQWAGSSNCSPRVHWAQEVVVAVVYVSGQEVAVVALMYISGQEVALVALMYIGGHEVVAAVLMYVH